MGKAFLLKIGDDSVPKHYATVAGLQVNSETVEPSGVAIEARGIFLGNDAEAMVRGHALAGTASDYELSFEDGERMRGRFLVQRVEYAGDFNGERAYAIDLSSVGPVRPA